MNDKAMLPGGLRLLPASWSAALRAAIFAVALACLTVLACDWLWRSQLSPDYLAHYTSALWPRTGVISLTAMKEELIYRLGLQTALCAVPLLFGRKVGPRWMIGAILLAQLVNVGALALYLLPYGLIRFWLVGAIWGWLYWRHGFVTALAAHGLAHFALDPLLLLALT